MAWLEETRSVRFELVRHFVARFFDSEMVTSAEQWQKAAIGLAATLLSAGYIVINIYWKRYAFLQAPSLSSPQKYHLEIRADMLLFIALALAITALVTVLEWQALFPTMRDCLALAGLPVPPRQIFLAKFTALALMFGAFVILLNLPWAALFAGAASGPWQEAATPVYLLANFVATAGASAFVFLSLLSVQGLLLNVLPVRAFTTISQLVQAGVFTITLGGLPLAGRQPRPGAEWWPPVWFLHLWEAIVERRPGMARSAVLALVVPSAIAVLSYLLSYHRYRKLLVETMTVRHEAPLPDGRGSQTTRAATVRERLARRAVFDAWIRDPHEQAAFSFIWKTLVRSRGHRLLLLAFGALAVGWITKAALDAPRPSLRDEGLYGLVVVLAPLSFALLAVLGLRNLFSLPVSLSANWLFQSVNKGGRAPWLAAVERFVIWCGIAPAFLVSLPAATAVLGGLRAAAVTLLALFAALIWFEALFRNWRKLPFTCSYLPGKQPVWLTLTCYAFGAVFLAPIGQLILYCSGEPAAFVALFSLEAAGWWWLRARRREIWAVSRLLYEEAEEAEVMPLHFEPAPGQIASSSPKSEASLFSASLVASRGFLPDAWAEEIDEERRHPSILLDTFLEDIRYGFRLIRRNPLLSAVVVLTLTVGIGINASVFTVVNGVALRPHVYQDPASFLRIIPYAQAQNRWRPASYAEYQALRDGARSLRQLAAYSNFEALIGDDDSTGSPGLLVSCNFFLVYGLPHPILGRLFVPEDCQAPDRVPPVVISESVWHSRFASDPRAVGRAIRVNNQSVVVAGVVPDGASGWTRPASIWVPYTGELAANPNAFTQESLLWLWLAGRLAPGVSRSQAQAELTLLEHQQDRLHPGRRTAVLTTDGSWAAELELTASGRNLMLIGFFLGAFNLVLFIACANVATLLLSRAAARKREIAVRLSLGAPRIRLVRMLITESLILAAVAGGLSLYLTTRLPKPLYRMVATRIPDFPMPIDWHIFAYISAVVLVTGILAGLAPALESVNVDLAASLKGAGGLVGAAFGTRVRGWLVAAQVAMSMVLLVGAGLFARSEDRALRGDPGYLPQRVVVVPLAFPNGGTIQSAQIRLQSIARQMRGIPGAHSVAFSDDLPLVRPQTLEVPPPLRTDALQPVDVFSASPGYFETMGIPLVRGREFRESDASGVIVSQSLARLFWRGQDPIGKLLSLPGGVEPVIGVARDIEPLRVGGSDNPPAYSLRRVDASHNVILVRFDVGASAGATAVRAAIRQVNPDLVVIARVLQSWLDQITEDLWNVVALIVILGIVATVLTITGIYGAVSFAVNQKTRDLGIRVALGATRLDIMREVVVSGGKPVLEGLVVGLWLSVATAAALRESVKGSPIRIDTTDPLLYGGIVLLLLLAALAAMFGPARRGAQADPITALRYE
jgi:predicted permease